MHEIGVGFFVGAGVPRGPRVNTFIECGCCGAYHRTDFNGDCREDSERHYDLPDDAEIVYADDESSRTDACEHCGTPTSFERTDPATQPPEGEVCSECNQWLCPDCAVVPCSEHD